MKLDFSKPAPKPDTLEECHQLISEGYFLTQPLVLLALFLSVPHLP
jgi:hypothetical protein